jgi:hypothetical protein
MDKKSEDVNREEMEEKEEKSDGEKEYGQCEEYVSITGRLW